ncbi:MAG: acetylxylan esterase, partial [Victivallales bacterium]|nr:acetylxylan esterase [Victivallales bacterium]
QYYDENCKKIQAWKSAADGRDAFFYREVFVRAMRAADYLKTRPEWNGKDFLAGGGSLAGAQTAAVAALDPQITLAFIHTPSNIGYNADLAGRKRGLPFHWQPESWITQEMRKAVPYCDVVNFAARIKCECYFCTGFADEVCTPSNVYSAYNNIPAGVKKIMTSNPRTGHYGTTVDFRAQQRLKEFFENKNLNP